MVSCNTYNVFLLLVIAVVSNSMKCNRKPDGITVPHSTVGNKFRIIMSNYNRTENLNAYMPNTKYIVTLKGDDSGPSTQKFTSFILSANNMNENLESGTFDLEDETLTKFSDKCPNSVIETTKIAKEDVSVIWTSPPKDNDCVLIRATVVESPDTWYMDEGGLVVNMCVAPKAEEDDQGPVLLECCACDEAKYEVTFEGLWSRNTHPKDFPSKGWLIKFSDVIGASHTVDYSFWKYHGMASEGLQQVAEFGATSKLESELKNQSEHIRTIIKARGISYPNVTGRTFAVFRVDRRHHLMSVVSMISPSPDWIVGVSGLELCLQNCSWIEHKELNLYPYDAGTDDGITYMSPKSPSEPQQPIQRISSTFPNDPRSPFYDETGQDMKPIAKLYLNRQRLYEKTCDDLSTEDPGTEACEVTDWGSWGDCSATCGRGYKLRQRDYRNSTAAMVNHCRKILTDRRKCFAERQCRGSEGRPGQRTTGILETDKCVISEWSSWSSCTTTCGSGITTRSRNFRHKNYRKQCIMEPDGPELQQTIDCENKPCLDDDGDMEKNCPRDLYTEWSLWSPCSSSCGRGVTQRSRFNKNRDEEDNDKDLDKCMRQAASCTAEISSCNFTVDEARSICNESLMEGRCNSSISRVYFNKYSGKCERFIYNGCDGNRNNFPTEEDCYNLCGSYQIVEESTENSKFNGIQPGSQVIDTTEEYEVRKVDCQVTDWSNWTPCRGCRGFTFRERIIKVQNQNGGKRCPKKVLQKRKCRKIPPCSQPHDDNMKQRSYRDENSIFDINDVSIDCEVTSWSPWSQCMATCGKSLQHRVRTIKIMPRGPIGKLCPVLSDYRYCNMIQCP